MHRHMDRKRKMSKLVYIKNVSSSTSSTECMDAIIPEDIYVSLYNDGKVRERAKLRLTLLLVYITKQC